MTKVFICEICGDAYIGEGEPHNCPFCGAKSNFIKPAFEARPIVNETIELTEVSRKNLLETLNLEINANAIYLCMAGKADSYAVKAMYKRLAKVEFEHATIVTKILEMEMPGIEGKSCNDDEEKNFDQTVELEEHATSLYHGFAQTATEKEIKIFFTALAQVEKEHIDLIAGIRPQWNAIMLVGQKK
jgi:rubrerythrin